MVAKQVSQYRREQKQIASTKCSQGARSKYIEAEGAEQITAVVLWDSGEALRPDEIRLRLVGRPH